MNAYEDTKSGNNIVSETLQNLARQAKICHGHIDLLEAAQHVNGTDVLADLNTLLDLCESIRDAVRSEDILATWSTKEELHALAGRLDQAATKRKRYLDLAQYLAAGTIAHRREKTRQERLAERDAAVAELIKVSELASPPPLPGPEVGEWLEWACSLEDSANASDLHTLKTSFPLLDDFVAQLEIEWWRAASESSSARLGEPIPEISPSPNNHSSNGHSSKNHSFDIAPVSEIDSLNESVQVVVEESTPEASKDDAPAAVLEESTPEVVKDSTPTPILKDRISEILRDIAPAVTETEPAEEVPVTYSLDELLKAQEESPVLLEDHPAEPHEENLADSFHSQVETVDDESDRISFFRAGEVERITKLLKDAKKKSKNSRKVRALVGASNWLLPRDQNPLLHPVGGIRAQTGYNRNSDAEIVSPLDAERIIDGTDELPLLTGGADLLRWALSQPTDNGFDGIAGVRRFTFKQLKQWFGELFHIELADQQFQDIQMLTSGVPLLVGEMHRLIIPAHDEPPTWLGHARWIEIKSSYGYRLSALAQELRSGPSAVRLKQREISVLKMVAVASEDSTPETIAANLSENWKNYNRPELNALTPADEPAIALLQELALLNLRSGSRVGSIESILPLESGDALRQFVRYL